MAIKFNIEKNLFTLGTNENGWSKEVNLVSWNDRDAKYDIREWSPDHKKMGKGVTLSEDELQELVRNLKEIKG